MEAPLCALPRPMLAFLAIALLTPGVQSDNGTCTATTSSPSAGDLGAQPQSLLQRGAVGSSSIEVSEAQSTHTVGVDHSHVSATDTGSEDKGVSRLHHSVLQTDSSDRSGTQFVTSNDLKSLSSSIIIHTTVMCVHVLVFAIARLKYPKVYANAWLAGRAPFSPGDGLFTWISASLKLTPEQVVRAAGLDAAMMLKYQDLCIKILLFMGMPMVLVMCPLYFIYGDAVEVDPLSRVDTQNLTDGSNMYWVQAVLVWVVVICVEYMVFRAQGEFLTLRYEWLRKMTVPRATTCMVQNIPSEYRTDAALKAYVDRMFMRKAVESVYVVRKLPEELHAKLEAVRVNRRKLQEVRYQWECDHKDPSKRPTHQAEELPPPHAKVDSIDHYSKRIASDVEDIQSIRTSIADKVKAGDHTACLPDGFVTFQHRHDAELGLSMRTRASADEVIFSMPPDPMDVRYEVLVDHGTMLVDGSNTEVRWRTGSFLMALIFFSYLPLVIGISLVTSLNTLRHIIPAFDDVLVDFPLLGNVWDGIVGTCILAFIISFVPTFMMLITRKFFGLAAETWCQHRLQHSYFHFQILFVLLIFCIGNSLFSTYLKLVRNPTRFFHLLASKLPQAGHFYLNFFPLQWAAHAGSLCRYVNLVKYLYYKRSIGEKEARELSEPEDQDYFGMGARSARFSLLFVIALVFNTVCPLICLMALIDAIVSRIAIGYLLVFAETRKADSGGHFWNSQLKHIQYGMFLYISLMVGILCERAGAYGPGLFAALSYIYLMDSYNRLEQQFSWHRLPFEEVVALQSNGKVVESCGHYVQPELTAESLLMLDSHVGRLE